MNIKYNKIGDQPSERVRQCYLSLYLSHFLHVYYCLFSLLILTITNGTNQGQGQFRGSVSSVRITLRFGF